MSEKKKYALLVIDYINDIVHEKGKTPSCSGYVKEHNVIQHTNSIIKLAREKNALIIFVKIGFSPNYCEHPENSPMFGKAKINNALKLEEWGTEFYSELNYIKNDIVVIKHRVSPFFGTSLEPILKANKIEGLLLSGVSTNNAIQAAARDGHDRDYEIIVLKDACGAANTQDHENAIYFMQRFSEIVEQDKMAKLL